MIDGETGASREAYDEGDLDLHAIARVVTRNRRWIIAITLGSFLATLAFVSLVKPRYTADAQVLLENQEDFLTKPDNLVNPAQAPDAEAVTSQIQLITSRDLARRAIKALHLRGNPEFDPAASSGLLHRLAVLVGLSRPLSATSEEDKILRNYNSRLTVFQVVKSRVLQIEFTSQDPQLAARAANTIANLYIKAQIAAKHAQAKAAAASLDAQIAVLRKRFVIAQQKAESFRAKSGMLLGANDVTLSTQQLADLNAQLVDARTAEAEAQAKAKLIRAMLLNHSLDQVSDVANNGLIRQLSEQRIVLRSQLALDLRTLLPQHPKVKELEAQIGELDKELRSAAINVARGLENDSKIAAVRVASIQSILDDQKKKVADNGSNAVRLRDLDQAAKLLGDELQARSSLYQEALARETSTSTPGDARVISRAMAPQYPSFPRKIPLLIFATLAGLVLSTGAIVAGAILSTGSSDGRPYFEPQEAPADDERDDAPLEPAAAAAEVERTAPTPAIEPAPASVSSSLARSLAAQRILAIKQPGRAVCALIAGMTADARAGATAAGVARELAREGRAILIELRMGALQGSGLGEIRRPSGGLRQLLAGDMSFAESIHRDDVSRLHYILAGGENAVRPGEAFDVVVEALGETYDFLVLVAGPIDSEDLARELASAADFVALISRGRAVETDALDARAAFSRAGARRVAVLSDADLGGRDDRVSAA